jgi:hypothetical protein
VRTPARSPPEHTPVRPQGEGPPRRYDE